MDKRQSVKCTGIHRGEQIYKISPRFNEQPINNADGTTSSTSAGHWSKQSSQFTSSLKNLVHIFRMTKSPKLSLHDKLVLLANDVPITEKGREDKTKRNPLSAVLIVGFCFLSVALGFTTCVVWLVHPTDHGDLCADRTFLLNKTRGECGGILDLAVRQVFTQPEAAVCSALKAEVRCLAVSLRRQGFQCSVKHVKAASNEKFCQGDLWYPWGDLVACDVAENDMDEISGETSRPDDICHRESILYILARTECPGLINSLEGSDNNKTDICQDLKLISRCLTSVLRNHRCNSTGSGLNRIASIFPYISTGTIEACKVPVRPNHRHCLVPLTVAEMGAFVTCSSYLSLETQPNSTSAHCKIYSYTIRCIEQKLRALRISCSTQDIAQRLAENLRKVHESYPMFIAQCQSFVNNYAGRDVCKEGDVLDMVVDNFCTHSNNRPFGLTAMVRPMSAMFVRCSNFSAMVTCASEFLTNAELSCHPAAIQQVMIQSDVITALIAPGFNHSDCAGSDGSARQHPVCEDGRSILRNVSHTCNIALDFLRKAKTKNFKCSYFRQFVTCAQALLQSRGFECFFDKLQEVLIRESFWFVTRSGFDPSYCSERRQMPA